MPAEPDQYLDKARAYWRYSPGGTGKIDSAALAQRPDAEFLATWRSEKDARRRVYWEEGHFLACFAERARGTDVFSFGCGLGYAELDLMDAGASVTFADIVPSCIASVERVCQLTGHLERSHFMLMDDSADTDFGGPYDICFAYGSLMHMPEARQQRVLANMTRALRPGGQIWLMLYTPKFVEAVGSTFDQTAFARGSDPSVGNLDNPWSDWHDDEKLQRVAGPGLRITKRELWNEDRYVWYGLERAADNPAPGVTPFVDLRGLETARLTRALNEAQMIADFDMTSAVASDATIDERGGVLTVRTGDNHFHYALTFPVLTLSAGPRPNCLVVDAEVERGGFEISLLDVKANKFFHSVSIARQGDVRACRDLSPVEWPADYQVVVSNYSPARPASSTFRLRRLALLYASDLRPA